MNAPLLRSALVANVVFSSISALAFLAGAGPIAELCGVARAEIASTGVGLVLFVGLLLVVITRRDLTRRRVKALAVVIASLDVLWVAGTPFSIGAYSAAGKWLFSGIAVVVGLLAAVQIAALAGISNRRVREPRFGLRSRS